VRVHTAAWHLSVHFNRGNSRHTVSLPLCQPPSVHQGALHRPRPCPPVPSALTASQLAETRDAGESCTHLGRDTACEVRYLRCRWVGRMQARLHRRCNPGSPPPEPPLRTPYVSKLGGHARGVRGYQTDRLRSSVVRRAVGTRRRALAAGSKSAGAHSKGLWPCRPPVTCAQTMGACRSHARAIARAFV
jgi:hypothetical protein